MEYVDLITGFALLGFADYKEYKWVRQLCHEKSKGVAYAGELTKIKEIQAKAWAKQVSIGWMDYHYSLQAFYHNEGLRPRPKGKGTAIQAIATAAMVLGEKCGYEVKYVLVVRK